MQCNNCNYENKNNARFCTECGTSLVDIDVGMAPDVSPANSRPNRASFSSVKDSIIIGDSGLMDADDMEEATKGIELLKQLKANKLENAASHQEIQNRARMVEAKARVMETEAKQGGSKRKGELIALDIAKTLNELRGHCTNNEDVFSISMTLDLLLKKVKDEKSIKLIESMSRRFDTMYDDFDKLNDDTKKQIIVLCKYIEEAYCAEIIHGDDGGDEESDNVVISGNGNVVATGGGVVNSVVNIRK